jgi:hypothetical protein
MSGYDIEVFGEVGKPYWRMVVEDASNTLYMYKTGGLCIFKHFVGRSTLRYTLNTATPDASLFKRYFLD